MPVQARPLALLVLALTLSCADSSVPDEIGAITQAVTAIPAIDFSTRPNYMPNNVIGLTFDDGPDDTNTPIVLDVLKQKGVKATFFINTDNFGTVDTSATLKAIIQRIVNEGHQLGNHTVHHLHLPDLSTTQIEAEITGVQTTVNRSDVLGPSFPALTMLRASVRRALPGRGTRPARLRQGGAHRGPARRAHGLGRRHRGLQLHDRHRHPEPRLRDQQLQERGEDSGTGDYGLVLMHCVHPQTAAAIGSIIDYAKSSGFVLKQGEDFVQARFGKSSHDIIFPPTCNQTPFGGTAPPRARHHPGRGLRHGGEGCAYHDTTAANQGNAYRTSEAVDVQPTTDAGGGFNVGFVQAGEWLEYTVNVATTGNYKLELRTAATATGKNLDVLVDGALIADNVALPNTGAFQTFATVTVPSVALSSGTHVLRVLFNTASENLNWIRFTALAGGPSASSSRPRAAPAPAPPPWWWSPTPPPRAASPSGPAPPAATPPSPPTATSPSPSPSPRPAATPSGAASWSAPPRRPTTHSGSASTAAASCSGTTSSPASATPGMRGTRSTTA
jgi:peptidoglycan/xylan/chitin deacetylase (PgdA/CDA1 family)